MGETCSCGAAMTWAKTEAGNRIPLDPEPHPAGNVVLDERRVATVYRLPEVAEVHAMGAPRYLSHFATCPDAEKHRTKGATIEGGMRPLRIPDERQVHAERTKLIRGQKVTPYILTVRQPGDRPIVRTLCYYYDQKRAATRRVDGTHLFGNRPGIAWNHELLAVLDARRPRPKALVVDRTDPKVDGSARKLYALTWDVVRRFVIAVEDGDTRWTVDYDVDDQILLPWPAWAGGWTAPPPHAETDEEPEPEQGALLEVPPDPKPPTPKFFV